MISIHINFHQNRIINKYARKKIPGILELPKDGVFFVLIEDLTFLKTNRDT